MTVNSLNDNSFCVYLIPFVTISCNIHIVKYLKWSWWKIKLKQLKNMHMAIVAFETTRSISKHRKAELLSPYHSFRLIPRIPKNLTWINADITSPHSEKWRRIASLTWTGATSTETAPRLPAPPSSSGPFMKNSPPPSAPSYVSPAGRRRKTLRRNAPIGPPSGRKRKPASPSG